MTLWRERCTAAVICIARVADTSKTCSVVVCGTVIVAVVHSHPCAAPVTSVVIIAVAVGTVIIVTSVVVEAIAVGTVVVVTSVVIITVIAVVGTVSAVITVEAVAVIVTHSCMGTTVIECMTTVSPVAHSSITVPAVSSTI